ncbi:MAG TPA: aminotransferase class III-fold pyridoxal phosphate-dependent enzyme [Acidimicrobiia bacterium]
MTVIPLSNRNRSDRLADSAAPRLVTELPGPRAREWIERDAAVASPSLGRVYPLVPARGDGLVIEDVDGNRYLDFNAGIAVTSTGHCHPRVVEAIERQSHALLHYCSSDWYIPSYIELCEGLADCAPAGMGATRTFLANSGTEAVEGAIKLARQHTGRPNVIAFHGAFHGRSLGSLALTASKARYRGGFGAMMPGVFHAPYGESGEIERTILTHLTPPSDVAAIFVEPIQGEGGYVIPPAGWLAELRALCDEHGILLVADEVQSGVGRTGRMWAVDHEGIAPDLLLVGKGIASGLPLAAIVARDEIMQWEAGAHGSTFGGNPVACEAALATLDLVEHGDQGVPLVDNARDVGAHLLAGLERMTDGHASVPGVHGRGLMIGVDFIDHDTAYAVEQECFRRGLLVLTCGVRTVRLAPPLVVTREQADQAVAILDDAVAAVEHTER